MTSLWLSPDPRIAPRRSTHVGGQPDQALAVHAGAVLVADAAERQRGRDGVEGGLADGDTDHVRTARSPAQPRRA